VWSGLPLNKENNFILLGVGLDGLNKGRDEFNHNLFQQQA
jgi:hypothetical protein